MGVCKSITFRCYENVLLEGAAGADNLVDFASEPWASAALATPWHAVQKLCKEAAAKKSELVERPVGQREQLLFMMRKTRSGLLIVNVASPPSRN